MLPRPMTTMRMKEMRRPLLLSSSVFFRAAAASSAPASRSSGGHHTLRANTPFESLSTTGRAVWGEGGGGIEDADGCNIVARGWPVHSASDGPKTSPQPRSPLRTDPSDHSDHRNIHTTKGSLWARCKGCWEDWAAHHWDTVQRNAKERGPLWVLFCAPLAKKKRQWRHTHPLAPAGACPARPCPYSAWPLGVTCRPRH